MLGLVFPWWVRWVAILTLAVASFAAGGALVADHYQGVAAKDSLSQSQGVVLSLIKANRKLAAQNKVIEAANEQAQKDDTVIRDLKYDLKRRVRLNTANVCPDTGHPAGNNSTGTGVASGALYQPGTKVVYPVENMLGYRQDITDGLNDCENLAKEMRRINASLKALKPTNQ